MDIEALKQGLSAIAAILGMLKQAKDLLPDGKNKEEIADEVEKAERQMQTAEIQIAKILGHEICVNHWPSGIMLSADKKIGNAQYVEMKLTTHPSHLNILSQVIDNKSLFTMNIQCIHLICN